MYRRDFLKKSAAALAVSGFPRYSEQLAGAKKRVGLIGRGCTASATCWARADRAVRRGLAL